MNNKKLILLSYYWPPASGPGVQRWVKFVKYLHQMSWDITVITPEFGSYPNTDPSLLNDVPQNINVLKTGTLEPFRAFNLLSGKKNKGNSSQVGMGDIKGDPSFIKKLAALIRANVFIPDARIGWMPFALKAAKKIISKDGADILITTGPPHSTHLAGLQLSKSENIPWLADFRDPWTNIYYNEFLPKSKLSKKIDKYFENRVSRKADALTVVSKGLKREFEDRSINIQMIPNGYDKEDFKHKIEYDKQQKFICSYIGNLKSNQHCLAFWESIADLNSELKGFKDKFRLVITGNIHNEVIDSIKNILPAEQVNIEAFVPHQEAIKKMVKSNALLFIIPNTKDNQKIITGKIFEYLASETPLISIGPEEGDAAEILNECDRSPMLDYSKKNEIKERLKNLFENWNKGLKSDVGKNKSYKKYSRQELTKELDQLLLRLIKHD